MSRLGERAAAFAVSVTLAVLAGGPAASAGTPPPTLAAAAAPASPCDTLPVHEQPPCRAFEQLMRTRDESIGDNIKSGLGSVADSVKGWIGGAVGGLADTAADTVLKAMTHFVVEGAVWFMGQIGEVVMTSTTIDVQAGWFRTHYGVMAGIGAMFCVAFLLVQAVGTVVHQDAGRLVRSVGLVAGSGVGTVIAVGIVAMLLAITDGLCARVMAGMGGDLRQSLTGSARGLTALSAGGGAAPLFAVLIAAFCAAVAALAIWIELLLRAAAVYATLLFFPLALAGMVWDGSRRWAGRLAKTLAALIFSKFLIVAVLSLAVGGLAAGSEGFTAVMVGVALLMLATFAPFLLFKVIGAFDDIAGAGAMHEARSGGQRGVMRGGQSALYTVRARAGGGRGGGVLVAPSAGGSGRAVGAASGGGAAPAMAGVAAIQKVGNASTSAVRVGANGVDAAVPAAPPPVPPRAPTTTRRS